jgi:hypothetical protein
MFDLRNRFSAATDGEIMLGLVVLLALVFYALVLFLKRVSAGPRSPEPWDAEVAAKLEDSTTTVLCHRCLVPNDPGADFCEQCGAAIGQYTNYLPFPYLFSMGHTLRLGTAGEYKRTPVTILGYILLALEEYLIFAPVYLYQLFRKLPQKPPPKPANA